MEQLTEDKALEALYAEPVRVVRPLRQAVPFIFASPHSGRIYPSSFIARSRLNPISLRRSEDAFVDELFAAAALDCAAPFVAARFPRAYLDANRLPGELDAAMFEGRLGLEVDTASPRVNAGLGVIPRIVRDGAEIYRDKLAPAEAEERLARLYRPYHAALLKLVEETLASFGAAVVVDCHSMPSAAAVPDVVLGDRYGVSATPQLMRAAERAFEHLAFTVGRNVPYAGGYTTLLYGRPAQGVHALQVEINRALYLDEERIVPGTRFDDVRARIAEVLRRLTEIDAAFLRPHRPFLRIHAAE
jgi:N-formylglutamate amidohydrolase